jgi:hypothetical protein
MEEIDIKKDAFKDRWVSYFDLLGFSDLVQTKGELHVFNTITMVIEEFKRELNSSDHIIERVWFSDSFIFYSPGDSANDFCAAQQFTHYFFLSLIQKEIPVRGALACGKVYADKDNNIIFGKGLLEAYKYAENQDWIGLILTPAAVQRMKEIGLPAEKRPYYVFWSIPSKKSKKGFQFPSELPACRIEIGIPGIPEALDSMRQKLDSKNKKEVIQKYDRTIEFSNKTKISRVN